jgi:phosphoribosylamine--glycine ligase
MTYKGISTPRIAILGNGGRESAFIQALLTDPQVETIFVFEANAGFVTEPRVVNVPLSGGRATDVVEFCLKNKVTLAITSSEQIQADGVGDKLTAAGIVVFGASQRATLIESDKAWSRAFMEKLGLPQPQHFKFSNPAKAIKAAHQNPQLRVVKATGLASGKGVIVCETAEEVEAAIKTIMEDKKFGAAGETILLEERLGWNDAQAEEISVMFYTDGHRLFPLPLAQDYKREFDYDQGKNTGGMGTHTARQILSRAEQQFVQTEIAQKLIDALRTDDRLFVGILYVGLMKTSDTRHNPHGLFIIEINSRGGDPETVVQLAGQSHTHFAQFLLACGQGDASGVKPPIFDKAEYVDVVLCAPAYPDGKSQGEVIVGLSPTVAEKRGEVQIIHAGTRFINGRTVTHGGRILNVVGKGQTRDHARKAAYQRIKKITFDGQRPKYRLDIGDRKSS